MIRPRVAYVAAPADVLPRDRDRLPGRPGPVDGPDVGRPRARSGRTRPTVQRLLPVDIGDLNRLYQLGFASWLPSTRDRRRRLLRHARQRPAGRRRRAPTWSARGARLAVVGNVLTHVDYRGRGFATAVTGAVTAELLRTCDQVVLNVRSDNPPALNAYRRLGYAEHVRFEERLVHRLGSPWPDLAAPLRRLFTRKETDPR